MNEQMAVEMGNKLALHTLYDDIYSILYDYLNLQDKVRLSQTCKAMKKVFTNYVNKRMPRLLNVKVLKEMRVFSENDRQYFWSHYGSRFQIIDFRNGNENGKTNESNWMCDVPMYQYCTNVGRIVLAPESNINWQNFLNDRNLDKVNELNLGASNIDNEEIKHLTKFQNLEKLGIFNSNLTGKYINLLSKVKHLTLRNCWNLDSNYLHNIYEDLNLISLDIRNSFHTDIDIALMGFDCTKLENFKYSWDINTNVIYQLAITYLTKLKSLTISQSSWIPIEGQFFDALAQHNKKDLRELKIVLSNKASGTVNVYETPFYLEKLEYLQNEFQRAFYGLDKNAAKENSILQFIIDED